MTPTVLVTGGTGFVASWCIVELLKQGYTVRTTVRNASKEAGVRRAVARQVDAGERCRSPSPISPGMPAGRRPWPAATMSCTWPRRCRRAVATTRRR